MSAVDIMTLNQKVVSKSRVRYLITVNEKSITLTRMNRPYWILAMAIASFIISLFVLGIVFLILALFLIFYFFLQRNTYEFDSSNTKVTAAGHKLTFIDQRGRIYTFNTSGEANSDLGAPQQQNAT